jgi:hypothetical protein
MKKLVDEHAEKMATMNSKMEEASRKAKENAARADSSVFTLEILELRWRVCDGTCDV